MTALSAAAPVRPRHGSVSRPSRPVSTPHQGALAPVVPLRPAMSRSMPMPARYEWTDRGLAVIVGLVLLVLAIMSVTLVGAFLSISDAPLPR